MSERIFEDGGDVQLRGQISSFDPDDNTYQVKVFMGSDEDGDVSEDYFTVYADALTWMQDAPIKTGDFVRPRTGKQVGQVMAIRKGHAWIDWSPFREDQTGFTSSGLGVLVLAEPEEVEEAQKKAA